MILKIENQILSRYLITKMEVRKQRVYICICICPKKYEWSSEAVIRLLF